MMLAAAILAIIIIIASAVRSFIGAHVPRRALLVLAVIGWYFLYTDSNNVIYGIFAVLATLMYVFAGE